MDRINALPDEVMSMIFHDESLEANFSEPENLIHIVLTCKRWRDLACSLPTLWCKLYIYASQPNDHSFDWLTERQIAHWLTKSGSALLDVDVEIGTYRGPSTMRSYTGWDNEKTDRLVATLPLLLREAQRWRTAGLRGVDIVKTFQRMQLTEASLEEKSFPNLRHLELKLISLNHPGLFETFFSPGLRKLVLDCVKLDVGLWSGFIEATPQIEEAEYTCIAWNGDTSFEFEGFTAAHTNLSRLSYRTKVLKKIDHPELGMVESRILYSLINRSPQLNTLEISDEDISCGVDVSDYPRLFGGESAEWFVSQPPIKCVRCLNVTLLYEVPGLYIGSDVRNLKEFAIMFPSVVHLVVACNFVSGPDVIHLDEEIRQFFGTKKLSEQINGFVLQLANIKTLTLDYVPINADCLIDLARELHNRNLSSHSLSINQSEEANAIAPTESALATEAEIILRIRAGGFTCREKYSEEYDGDYYTNYVEWISEEKLHNLVEEAVPGLQMIHLDSEQ
jgi:hypothetical protein